MSKARKQVRRIRRLEDKHRRDLIALRREMLAAIPAAVKAELVIAEVLPTEKVR